MANSVFQEAIGHAITMHNGLTPREREIAETAARAAYHWTIREMIEGLKEKIDAR